MFKKINPGLQYSGLFINMITILIILKIVHIIFLGIRIIQFEEKK